MVEILPFRALRPNATLAPRVAAVPYDVVTTEEARALTAGNRESFLRVTRAEVDLPERTDPHDDRVYERARANLEELISRDAILRDGNILHRGTPNLTDAPRPMLDQTYKKNVSVPDRA